MTLEEIYHIIQANIEANNNKLVLSAQTIPSPGITAIFDKILLNTDLIVDKAVAELTTNSVTVTGTGSSFIFFNTIIDTLTFTVDDGLPSLNVAAEAIIREEDGWTFGSSFPSLKLSNWDGFRNPGNNNWIQYIFFDSAAFSLSSQGLHFSGYLMLTGMLAPLSILFNGMTKVPVSGDITVNTGENGYTADTQTAVPVMTLKGTIGLVNLQLGSLPVFTLGFSMNATAYIISGGANIGMPFPNLALLITSTIPVNDEPFGVAGVVGTIAGALNLQAVLPENTAIGLSELISLANDENLLALIPSNIPVIDDFVLQGWQATFNTREKTLMVLDIQTGTRETFSWTIIPGYITLTSVQLSFSLMYMNSQLNPSLIIEGIVTLGANSSGVNFAMAASFPGYVFLGSLDPDTPLDLRPILVYLLGSTIGNSLPDTLQLGILNMSIDPKNNTYSLETALTTDLEIPVVLTTIVVTQVVFNINYIAGTPTGSLTGDFQIGTEEDAPVVSVTAAYNGPDDGWFFSGGLKDGSEISLQNLIDTYLPEEYHSFDSVDIAITSLLVTFTQGDVKSYTFKLGAQWTLNLGLTDPVIITGLTDIAYAPDNETQYTGYIEGSLSLGNILLTARVDFLDSYNDYTFTLNNVFVAKLTQNADKDSVICFQFTTATSLGDMIEWLVTAATGQNITLPSPWSVMNNIHLQDFGFSFNLTKNKIGLSYRPGVNLGFIDIKEITLFYTYYPDDPQKAPLVEIAITQGSFLGGALPLPDAWNVLEPDTAPAVPGQGGKLFRLDFLGMGQHVALKDGLSPNSVSEAVDLLKAGFATDTKTPTNPIDGTGLVFNSSSNWLIGTQFVIVDTFALGIVFFDPYLYGLSLYVNGPKADVFQGLKFEILYKKVSDSVGVFQAYLKLPDAIRQIDFGTVSVTLPSLKIYIYTNGDFKIDLGFPVNEDFSESFGLQMLPFMGSGGFYFGLLSAETADTMPAASNGNFSPVIVFGVGLRVGVGKDINQGMLKAGISIAVQGIVEGKYAQFNYYDSTRTDNPVYFYTLGMISIVGHVYGSVDFLIISADVDLKVFVSARIVFESYEPFYINLAAGVSVSVKVRINLGFFKVTIGMSFSTTINESFTIGTVGVKPWITASPYADQFRPLKLRALDEDIPCPVIPPMNWLPIIPTEKVVLEIIYIPQFTVATEDDGGQSARAVAMLYLESSIDQPSPKKQVTVNDEPTEIDYPFTQFAKGVFLWTLGAYFNKTTEGIPVNTLLQTEITIDDLNKILCYFSQDNLVTPFTLDEVYGFMSDYLEAYLVTPSRYAQIVASITVSVLPMLPNLVLETPDGDIYFSNEKATYTYGQDQLKLIHDYFNALAVKNTGAKKGEGTSSATATDDEKQSLATYMLIDYLSLLAKECSQNGIDRLTALGLTVAEGESLADIVSKYPHFGISAIELAYSNRLRNLSDGITLHIPPLKYTVKEQDTLESIADRFNIAGSEIIGANTYLKELIDNPCGTNPQVKQVQKVTGFYDHGAPVPGATIVIPGVKHITSALAGKADNFLSIANRYRINVLDLIAENIAVQGIFPPGKKILVPYADKMTIADLIAAMDENNDFEQLSGLSANIMLQGLRVPLPQADGSVGEPAAMYKVSGQQIDASALVADQQLTLKLEEPLEWLNLGLPGGTELPYTLLQSDIDALAALQREPLTPVILELAATPLFDVQPRKFPLPNSITWQMSGAATNVSQDTDDFSIWMFPNSLEVMLNGYDAIAPKVELVKQVQETKTRLAAPDPIHDSSWATKIEVRLTTVKSAEDATKLMPNVYELQGIDQASMSLLRNLLEYNANNPGAGLNPIVNILYSKEPAQEGQTAPPNGLMSDSQLNTSIFLLQTNLSTLSNPLQQSVNGQAFQPGAQQNLLGMDAMEFLQYVWEAAIVNSGGYYLYYRINDSNEGLPDYLFNGDSDHVITLLITYNLQDNILLNFLNCVVIGDPVNIQDEILYVETLAQTTEGVRTGEKDTLAVVAKRYSTTVSKIALQNTHVLLKAGIRISIPPLADAGHLLTALDTLESVAAHYGVTVIALAHANKHVPALFDGPLSFDNRIEVKVATVPPGNIGFSMKRQNPENVPDLGPVGVNLQELYNLLAYKVAGNADFNESVPGLPVAPGDNEYVPPTDLDVIIRPSANDAADYLYNRILPVYPFAKTTTAEDTGDDVPPAIENPYRAVGKTAQVDLWWQDIFGNQTSFTNSGATTALPPQQIGYIDPVIGLSLYPSVSASYIIKKPDGGDASLFVTLAFNPVNYVPAAEDDEAWRQRATTDRNTYQQIYYQLSQEDMAVTLSCSLDSSIGSKAWVNDPKTILYNMVLAIYQYLGQLLQASSDPYTFYTVTQDGETLEEVATTFDTTPENLRRINSSIPADGILTKGEVIIVLPITIPEDQQIITPVSDANEQSLFALVTVFTLSRDINLVDDHFKDEPSVIASAAVLGPNLTSSLAVSNSNTITIQQFAQQLQDAFPGLKVASGTPQLGVEEDSAVEIWVIRMSDTDTGIRFSIEDAGNPFYFALLPLSTHLLSRDGVMIYPYQTGVPVYDSTPVAASFNAVDIEKLGQTCLSAIDTFLQADFAVPAWLIENAILDTVILYPYQYIIEAKKLLAANIASHMAAVLNDGNTPGVNSIQQAQERLRQELLISLSNAYTIDTILQFPVKVTSPFTDPEAVIAPNLFGKVLNPNDTSSDDQKAYAFSTTRFSLENSGTDDSSYLTILFNTKKDNNSSAEGAYFPIDLQYEINAIEHNIENVAGITGYQSSSWLTFVLPFGNDDTELGSLKIPIPLRAYPTSPSLTAQTFSSTAATGDDKLQLAKEWDYTFTYDYLRAQQDTINTDIILNVAADNLNAAMFTDEDDPDLFAALLQFSSAYAGIQKDLNQYLLDQSNPQYAFTAMQSLAWLVKRVANAWGNWQEDIALYRDTATGQASYNYQVEESEKEIDGQSALLISVTPQPGSEDFQLPEIDLPDFQTEVVEDDPAIRSFAYYINSNGVKTYLNPEDGRRITQRIISYSKFNIINQENVWSGISVIRNKVLVPGIDTNPAFIYTTPTIRFIDVLTPLLDPNIPVNMADYTPSGGQQPLQVYLSNFIKALFVELITEETYRQMKIMTGYSYNVQEGVESLRTQIPIWLTTPFNFEIPDDWNTSLCPEDPDDITPDSPFVCQQAALIQKWFAANRPVTTNGMFTMDISLFSGMSNTQLPVLRLRNLYLEEKVIQWS